MDKLQLLIDLHLPAHRQGPGGETETRRAIELAGLSGQSGLRIADIGCGTGASTLVLARTLDAHITAVDFLPEFLGALNTRAAHAGLAERVSTHKASMEALPFGPDSLDVIWSEGAIYNMGFEAGVRAWRTFLKPGGVLVVSELTWLTDTRPAELDAHWAKAYPEVATASAKMSVLEGNGYTPIGYFTLPEHCWREGYYGPLQQRFPAFLATHQHSDTAQALVEEERREIELYECYHPYFSYGFYIARKNSGLPDSKGAFRPNAVQSSLVHAPTLYTSA